MGDFWGSYQPTGGSLDKATPDTLVICDSSLCVGNVTAFVWRLAMRTRHRLVMFIAAVLCAAWSVKGVHANRGYSSDIVYFSSSSLQTAVGEAYVDCNWHSSMLWGVTSNYATYYNDSCTTFSGYYVCFAPSGFICPSGYYCIAETEACDNPGINCPPDCPPGGGD